MKKTYILIMFILLLLIVLISLIIYTNALLNKPRNSTLSYYQTLSKPIENQATVVSYHVDSIDSSYSETLAVPSMFPDRIYKIDLTFNSLNYKVSKKDEYTLNIETPSSIFQISTGTGDFGYGFNTYIPQYTSIKNIFYNDNFKRINYENDDINKLKTELGENFEIYSYYSNNFYLGGSSECQTSTDYSCPGYIGTFNLNRSDLPSANIRLICASKTDFLDCDEIFKNLNIK